MRSKLPRIASHQSPARKAARSPTPFAAALCRATRSAASERSTPIPMALREFVEERRQDAARSGAEIEAAQGRGPVRPRRPERPRPGSRCPAAAPGCRAPAGTAGPRTPRRRGCGPPARRRGAAPGPRRARRRLVGGEAPVAVDEEVARLQAEDAEQEEAGVPRRLAEAAALRSAVLRRRASRRDGPRARSCRHGGAQAMPSAASSSA